MADLEISTLHASLTDRALNSMNFLNEISHHYPEAISLAAGRPTEEFFDLDDIPRYLSRFAAHLRERGLDEPTVRRTILQYGRTKGIVHELVSRNLAVDEDIHVAPEAIVVTAGCQEAMLLTLRALRADATDVLLAIAPAYVGITGAARVVDLPMLPVPDLDELLAVVKAARADGLRPRGFYVMPDFANPSGRRLDLATRHRLLEIAAAEDLLLLEDNPYGLFPAAGVDRLPTLKALDTERRVVYLGSFAKTGLPGARVGYVVADQTVSTGGLFADELSKLKSMVTVNTSPIAQAVIGGKLLDCDFSLTAANQREREIYADNLRVLTDGLAARFPGGEISWTVPSGGFFVVVTVPFAVDDALLTKSAREYGVLWTPMSHFYDTDAPVNALRLSCSAVTPAELQVGLDRLAAFITDQLVLST
ncbi:PLP-dependent aminotransferase family protein [Kribbella albertanoniae]|uniref:PLP-dependent aminotransferase family protein n=1 Tax=Kribbella albertanoniae TaxID=1266829 RepID=A0A4R4P3K5_9ACTN|nr:PLP-dependent aminotransferase family protein [Kribbella albertanoniae]TDC16928.1 PLP-dependent aminotransferase family protein [Kribbella albertanoniae]